MYPWLSSLSYWLCKKIHINLMFLKNSNKGKIIDNDCQQNQDDYYHRITLCFDKKTYSCMCGKSYSRFFFFLILFPFLFTNLFTFFSVPLIELKSLLSKLLHALVLDPFFYISYLKHYYYHRHHHQQISLCLFQ